MESLLKTAKVRIQSLGRDMEIRELPYKAQMEIIEAHRSGNDQATAMIMCKNGVIGWENEADEAIQTNVSMRVLKEIAEKIQELSGVGEEETERKNSVSAPNGDSSSALQLN